MTRSSPSSLTASGSRSWRSSGAAEQLPSSRRAHRAARANDLSLGGHDYLFEASRRGIEELQKYVPSEACSLSSDAQIWAPWKEGTKTHKMLTAIAQKTIEQGRAGGAAAQHLE